MKHLWNYELTCFKDLSVKGSCPIQPLCFQKMFPFQNYLWWIKWRKYHILAYFVYLKYLMYIMYLVYLVHLMYLMYLVYLMYLHPFWTIFYLHILLLVSSHQANKTWTESLSFRQNMSTNEDSFKTASIEYSLKITNEFRDKTCCRCAH